mmetsp:Transcript_83996/g.136176  ORF Transcript_83996/g.136176 Transcript_83996/m.136176 type:complete len:112 (+) Transcript_83996:1211-1546(+)
MFFSLRLAGLTAAVWIGNMLIAPLVILSSNYHPQPFGCGANDDLCTATDGFMEPPPAAYGSWVIGDHGGHYMRNPHGCMPRTKGMQGHCAEKSGSGPICHDGANRVVGCPT